MFEEINYENVSSENYFDYIQMMKDAEELEELKKINSEDERKK